MSLLISSELCSFTLTWVWHICRSLPGHSGSQDFTLKHQTKTGGTAAAPGMPRSGSGEELYIPGTHPASLCRAWGLRGVCTILGSFLEWWTELYLFPTLHKFSFHWLKRESLNEVHVPLTLLPSQARDGEPLRANGFHLFGWPPGWLAPAPGTLRELGWRPEGTQATSSAKTHWSRIREGV